MARSRWLAVRSPHVAGAGMAGDPMRLVFRLRNWLLEAVVMGRTA